VSTALERQVMAQVLQTYVQAQDPVIPVDWPNRVFEKPLSGPWIRFTVLDATSQQLEMGSSTNQYRVYGSLILQVFWPADAGDGDALALADTLSGLYRQRILNFTDMPSSGLVRMRAPLVKVVGRKDAYFQVNVVIPFHRDDLP